MKLGDRQVTALKIALLAVESANIANAAITTAKIQNAAITTLLVADAAITDAKIGSLSANKITAGIITATVQMTSPDIQVTSNILGQSQVVSINAANSVKVTSTGGDGYAQMTWDGITVGVPSNINIVTALNAAELVLLHSGVSSTFICTQFVAELSLNRFAAGGITSRILINGQQVLTNKQAAIAFVVGSGGIVVDIQARAKIDEVLQMLKTHGLCS